ncbi:hypothetical protein KAU43_06325 [candidate division WOR-3 bacterium]|nr:hypothetical protein [candidate division WOR-3 bacterium]
MQKKRCYFGCVEGELTGVSVISNNIKDAKKLLFEILTLDHGLECWTDMRVRWQRKARIEKYPIGFAFLSEEEIQEGVECGAYGFYEEGTCRSCGEITFIYSIDKPPFAVCDDCCEECLKDSKSEQDKDRGK